MNRINVRKVGKVGVNKKLARVNKRQQSVLFNDSRIIQLDEYQTIPNLQPSNVDPVGHLDRSFAQRHIGPGVKEQRAMLDTLGYTTLEELIEETIPDVIRHKSKLLISDPISEANMRARFEEAGAMNGTAKSFIGLGYHNCNPPAPIIRDVLLNPGWHTQYSPYQAEISQGRLQSLLNFQTMVTDLTALEVANSSLLDEGTAACEAVSLMINATKKRKVVFLDEKLHPQTIACIKTRAQFKDIELVITNRDEMVKQVDKNTIGVVTQYPDTEGTLTNLSQLVDATHTAGGLVSVASDLLALSVIKPPGEYGADVCFGSAQRLGIPMYLGGPSAAFFATKKAYQRQVPGRIVGVSKDADGKTALRLSLQAREQHIRREKATSNVCTAQALLANGAAMWGVYHGPEGMIEIAEGIHDATCIIAHGAEVAGYKVLNDAFFDTIKIDVGLDKEYVLQRATEMDINLRSYPNESCIGVALDDTVTSEDLNKILAALNCPLAVEDLNAIDVDQIDQLSFNQAMPEIVRTSKFMEHENFHKVRSELELVRYIKELERTDLSMVHSMIPLGSCTMKLNAASQLEYLQMPGFARAHPFAPENQQRGWSMIFRELEQDLAEITGYDKVSLQPNSGAQGEFAGLAAISAFHKSRGDNDRVECLIPTSAHGTNPASATMAGLKVRPIKVNPDGSINMTSLKDSLNKYSGSVNSIMVTYPSTFGVFDEDIAEICALVHEKGGQVYLDGANMNAQSGLCRPGKYGADVSHLNLHKTFAIPHGGGGPGAGPIGVRAHLAPFLPSHPITPFYNHETSLGTISAAPFGNAGVLPISWAYIKMLGAQGVKKSSEVAILNANYMRKRLEGHYNILFVGSKGNCAHEFIIDIRPFKKTAGINGVDVAKRLMDYGFHAPTMSWPVADTLMIEPTESEAKGELDRYCDALIAIRREIADIENGIASKDNNLLKNAPHTMQTTMSDSWTRPYSRQEAAFPSPHQNGANKFWPLVSRLNDKLGDTNLVCTCPPMESYTV